MKQRKDLRENGIAILEAYHEFHEAHRRFPTYRELAAVTGLSPATVSNHFTKYKVRLGDSPARILTEKVIGSIYDSAINGNTASQRLWVDVMGAEGKPDKQADKQKEEPPLELTIHLTEDAE